MHFSSVLAELLFSTFTFSPLSPSLHLHLLFSTFTFTLSSLPHHTFSTSTSTSTSAHPFCWQVLSHER